MLEPQHGRLYQSFGFIKDIDPVVPGKVWICRVNYAKDQPGKIWRAILLVPEPSPIQPGQPFTLRGHVYETKTWRGKTFGVRVYGWLQPFHGWSETYANTEAEAERILRIMAQVVA